MAIPTDFSNLFLWLKGDVGAFSDSGGTTPCNDGDVVTRWNDQSGNGRNVTSSGTGKPIFKTSLVNGKPGVRFNGSTSLPLTFSGGNGSSYSCFFIHKRIDTASNSGLIGFNTGGGGLDGTYASRGSDSSKQFGVWDNNNGWKQSNQISTSAYKVCACVRDNSAKTIKFWIDDSLQHTRTYASTPPSTTAGWVGRTHDSGEILNGDIVELVHYTAALSDANASAISQYLLGRLTPSVGRAFCAGMIG